jgi:hypothetical protein
LAKLSQNLLVAEPSLGCRRGPRRGRRGCCGWIVDEPVGQVVEGKPADRRALVGFPVGRCAGPSPGFEEEAEAGFRARAVDVEGVDQARVGGIEMNADFFLGFADGGVEDRRPRVEFAGGQVPQAVEKRGGIAAAGEQDVVVAEEKDVDVDQMTVGHGAS